MLLLVTRLVMMEWRINQIRESTSVLSHVSLCLLIQGSTFETIETLKMFCLISLNKCPLPSKSQFELIAKMWKCLSLETGSDWDDICIWDWLQLHSSSDCICQWSIQPMMRKATMWHLNIFTRHQLERRARKTVDENHSNNCCF